MKRSVKVHQKKPGRPATGRDPAVTVRLPQYVLDQVKTWATQDGNMNRSQAIGRLVEIGLTVNMKASPSQRLKAVRADRANELAANTIEKIIDPAAPADERTERKRRLTKGPAEFREHRMDQPKPKR